MPGNYVSDGKKWNPANVQHFTGGRVDPVAFASDKRVVGVTRDILGPDGKISRVTVMVPLRDAIVRGQGGSVMTFKESLGDPIMVPDKNGKMVPLITPDPAAVEDIHQTYGEDETSLPVSHPPESKPAPIIVNAVGTETTVSELSKAKEEIAQLRGMIEAMANKKGK